MAVQKGEKKRNLFVGRKKRGLCRKSFGGEKKRGKRGGRRG